MIATAALATAALLSLAALAVIVRAALAVRADDKAKAALRNGR